VTTQVSHTAISKNSASELVFEIRCDELPFNDCTESKQIVLSEFTGDGNTQSFSSSTMSIANVMCILNTSETYGVLVERERERDPLLLLLLLPRLEVSKIVLSFSLTSLHLFL